jgi:polyhydroxybutyrate depolymerase
VSRTYTVYIPVGVTHPSALVVNLHGGGGSGRDEEALTHYDAVADAHGFVVVYPDGIDKNWADGRGASPPDRNGIDDVGFLVALVGKLVHDYGIDAGHVFATGISNGAFMANRLACERADIFAAIAPVAGTLGTNVACAPSRPVAVLAAHGTTDPIVPFSGGQMHGRGGASTIVAAPTMAARWRELDGCQGDPAQDVLPDSGDGTRVHRFTAASCANGTAVVFMQIDGGGHTWPDGTQYLPKAVIGTTSHVFDSSETTWEFFAGHAR